MNHAAANRTAFAILVSTVGQRSGAGLLIDSIRSFGGALGGCPIWLFEADPQRAPCATLAGDGIEVIPLTVPDALRDYWFSGKVFACARAEELAAASVDSQVWLSADCLVIQPPLLFSLDASCDAAVRPVHVRNVGLGAAEPLNDYWRKVYETVGVQDVEFTVESFVDGQRLRAYFNSHVFAVDPSKGLFRRWSECFASLVRDRAFQSSACQDELQRVFLHQAVLSALTVTVLDPGRLRLLPADYSYPYNLHSSVPLERRARALNDLVCIAYEDRPLDPRLVDDVEIHEPLWSWLAERV